MRNNGLIVIACFGIFVAHMFALTVELVDGSTGPSPASFSVQAPAGPPSLSQDADASAPQMIPATYSSPSAPLPQPAPQDMQRVDINYPQRWAN